MTVALTIGGFLFGATFGYGLAACLFIAKKSDKQIQRLSQSDVNEY